MPGTSTSISTEGDYPMQTLKDVPDIQFIAIKESSKFGVDTERRSKTLND